MSEMHSSVVVILGIINAAHHTLVIAEEENCETRNAINSDEKLAFF